MDLHCKHDIVRPAASAWRKQERNRDMNAIGGVSNRVRHRDGRLSTSIELDVFVVTPQTEIRQVKQAVKSTLTLLGSLG